MNIHRLNSNKFVNDMGDVSLPDPIPKFLDLEIILCGGSGAKIKIVFSQLDGYFMLERSSAKDINSLFTKTLAIIWRLLCCNKLYVEQVPVDNIQY